ncbi:MAG TPA: glycerophosphodiester phosphodiesterase family protein [Xanthomonadales bacterium]|nr:glycerophosphodiester phosphodiesterase family protein [Xanthomonadales bacterium]
MAWTTLDGSPPQVIAHRGASGYLPEHTLEAYALAIAQGADVIEPDLVVTRDGVLVARHDRGLSRSTDVARRPEFATRAIEDPSGRPEWRIDDFSWGELTRLRAVQPFAGRSDAHDGRLKIPSFHEVLKLACEESERRGRPVAVYPELKHPAAFLASGHDVVELLLRDVANMRKRHQGQVDVWVQCFEPEPLWRVKREAGLRCFLLLEAATISGRDVFPLLVDGSDRLDGLAPEKLALIDHRGRETGLVSRAHARGFGVHTWTFRNDRPNPAFRGATDELVAFFMAGIDAAFGDFPDVAVHARAEAARRRPAVGSPTH